MYMNSTWIQNNWFKVTFLTLLFSLVIVLGVLTYKYQKSPVQNAASAKPNIVYLQATSTSSTSSAIDLPAMVQEWYPSVVRVECYIREAGGDMALQSGSGFLTKQGGKIGVLTNKHVVVGEAGESPKLCTVKLANNEDSYIAEDPSSETKGEVVVSDTLDWGYIRITYPNADFQKAATDKRSFCKAKASLGAGVVIMGYPSVGSESDITVTQGIISGFEDEYYITDAKIGHGNSGGIAIKADKKSKSSCLVGIPSFAIIGEVVNLGRILDIASVQADPLFKFSNE